MSQRLPEYIRTQSRAQKLDRQTFSSCKHRLDKIIKIFSFQTQLYKIHTVHPNCFVNKQAPFSFEHVMMDYVSELCINLMLFMTATQLLMLLIRRAGRRSQQSCTELSMKEPPRCQPESSQWGQPMITAAPGEDEGELIYLPPLHIMSPHTHPNTHWLACRERRTQRSRSVSSCTFRSHRGATKPLE